MQIIEPLKTDKKLVEYLTEDVKKVGVVFFHGVGDCVQFMTSFDKLKALYPKIQFDLMIQNGLGEEVLFPEAIQTGITEIQEMHEYDYIFLVHFPVETDPTCTKSELCCKTELGITATTGHKKLPVYPSKLIGLHFFNTALPDVFNTPPEIAEKVWNEVLDAGFVPIELAFQHVFHNPVNAKYPFIDCTVRRAKADLKTLLGLIEACAGIICSVSGPLHLALANHPERVFYLDKGVPITRFTYYPVPTVNVNNYQEGKVRMWLNELR